MTRLGPARWYRRLWPQKVRTRLTIIYAGLFLASGTLLLGLTYGLVAANLPAQAKTVGEPPMTLGDFIKLCKQPNPRPSLPTKSGNTPTPKQSSGAAGKIKHECDQESAYLAGSRAAATNQRNRALHYLLLFSALGLGLMTIISGLAGWVVAGRVLKPVRVITGAARRASDQHLGERIALSGARDELKELADTFDDMLERLDQAFTAQRRFVADASHELRTPLTVMRTAIDVTLAKPGRKPEQLEAMAVRVRRAIDRAEAMIDALLTLAVSEQGHVHRAEPFNLATAAEDAIDAAAPQIERLALRLRADLEPAEVAGDPQLLDRMVANLVDNAMRHNTRGGEVRLVTGVRAGTAFLRIINSGPVVPPGVLPTLFEPFRRLEDRTGVGGAGLGLAIARSVAALHATTLEAHSRPAGGLDIEVAMTARCAREPLPR